jgi:NTE family protein
MREIKTLFVLIFILFLSNIFPQNKYTISLELKEKQLPFGLKKLVPANKPQIGLALSGGGARGLSQIGVLKALEEANISADIIVGTSMGSIVGGLYAAGYSIEELDSIARNTDWDDLLGFNNQSNRKDLFVDQKVTEDRAIFSLRLDGFSPILPTSFNDGQKLSNQLNSLTLNAPLHSDTTFDYFSAKFRAVCTDLISGDMILLDRGSLSNALRASSSVTFFLAPIKMDSLLLVDGGLVANIPTSVARNIGADFVVAINTTSNLWPVEELSVPWVVADQIVSIPMKQNNAKQLEDADFILTPNIKNILSTDFARVDSLILLGYYTTENKMKLLKAKVDSITYDSFSPQEKYFKNLKLSENLTTEEKSFFSDYQMKDSVSSKKINYDLYMLFETGIYKNLSVEIVETEKGNRLELIKEENPIISNIKVAGVTLFNQQAATEIFNSLLGKHYSSKNLLSKLIALVKLYRKNGYALAEIYKVDFDDDSGTLKIYVNEGIISRIEVVGNENTNTSVITREINFNEGSIFQIQELEKGLTNLRSTRLFANIDVSLRKEKDQNILFINVEEKPSKLLRVGLRIDNEYRAQLSLDIREENLFGTGTELGLIFFGGLENRAYTIEQKANRIFDTYLTYKINGFYKFNNVRVYEDVPTEDESTFSRVETGKYKQTFYGFSLGIGTQAGRFGNLIFEGRYQFDEVTNINNDPVTPYKTKIVSLKISTTIDTQDKYPYPQTGVYFTGFYETAASVLGGEVGYSKLSLEYKNFFQLSQRQVISPKIQFGFADKTLPLSEQFALGGQESFFGMREYEFRGRQIFLASLMYRYKLPIEIFFETYFKFRYDLGNTWAEQEQIKFKDLRHGIGGAISFDTPIGPAEFAVGRSFLFRKDLPENPISWGDVLFYFSIGYYY